jgi:hypothetical protein
MYLYSGLQRGRLSASLLTVEQETKYLSYFSDPIISQFLPDVGDTLTQLLNGYVLVAGTPTEDTVPFAGAAPASGAVANGSLIMQGFVGQGWAVLLRKDAVDALTNAAPISGFFTRSPADIQKLTGKNGQYAILKPFTPAGTTQAPAPPPSQKVSFRTLTDYSGLLTAATVLIAAATLLSVLFSKKPPKANPVAPCAY